MLTQVLRNEDYAKWLSAYKEIYSKFIAGHEPDSSKPVKIAVLDTGIDEDHSVFCAHNDITKKINFYNLNKRADVKDTHGHGTFVTSLVLDYSPDADVHVIKISDRDNASPNAKIVKAVSEFEYKYRCRPYENAYWSQSNILKLISFRLLITQSTCGKWTSFPCRSGGHQPTLMATRSWKTP